MMVTTIAAVAVFVLAAPASAGPAATPDELLVSDRTLDAVGLTAGEGVERVLPARPECSVIERATEAAAETVTATASRRSTGRRHGALLDEVVRVFDSPRAARAFAEPYREEDPEEECVEAVLAELLAERGVVLDTFADDRTVELGRAIPFAYLAEATYVAGSRERKVRAEQIVARSGATVVDLFVIAPESDFVEVATRVERDLAARFRAARQ
jgi:hypothetical protein